MDYLPHDTQIYNNTQLRKSVQDSQNDYNDRSAMNQDQSSDNMNLYTNENLQSDNPYGDLTGISGPNSLLQSRLNLNNRNRDTQMT